MAHLFICIIVLAALTQAASAQQTEIPHTILISVGPIVSGSDRAERDAAYQLDETAYGHTITRDNDWYESEPNRKTITLSEYRITQTLITNAQYGAFVKATGQATPDVDKETWKSYGLIHSWGLN